MSFYIRLCLRQIVGVVLGVILLAVIAAFQGGVPARIAYLREMWKERSVPVVDPWVRRRKEIEMDRSILR